MSDDTANGSNQRLYHLVNEVKKRQRRDGCAISTYRNQNNKKIKRIRFQFLVWTCSNVLGPVLINHKEDKGKKRQVNTLENARPVKLYK